MACTSTSTEGFGPRPLPPVSGEVLAVTDMRLNVACASSCCLADPWLAGYGAMTPELAAKVRSEIPTTPVPRKIALGLRALRESPTTEDARLAERYLNDFRPAGQVPTVTITQQAAQCYPVTWDETSPSNEAIALLSRLYARPFTSAAEYAQFRATTADPDSDFDVWVGRLERQRPANGEDVAALSARGGDLFVRVAATYCADDTACGIDRAQVADALKRTPGSALGWLRGQGAFGRAAPEAAFQKGAAFILSEGERLFISADAPALKQIAAQNALHGPNRARLAVLLAHLEPQSRRAVFGAFLATNEASGRSIVLGEWAKKDPSGCRQACAPFFFRAGAGSPDDDTAAIVTGLVAATEPTKGIFWSLMTERPPLPDDPTALEAAVDAGNTFGCAGLPERAKLRPRGSKGMTHAEHELEKHAASEVRQAAAARLKACANDLAK